VLTNKECVFYRECSTCATYIRILYSVELEPRQGLEPNS